MNTSLRQSLLAVILLTALTACTEAAPRIMPEKQIKVGQQTLTVEVADNENDRQLGLMHRDKMAAQHGMLFIFDDNQPYCMWMKNTLIPLSVAFADESGQILNIEDMQPQTENPHCAVGAARYALEMNLGWFAEHKIQPGAKIELLGIKK